MILPGVQLLPGKRQESHTNCKLGYDCTGWDQFPAGNVHQPITVTAEVKQDVKADPTAYKKAL